MLTKAQRDALLSEAKFIGSKAQAEGRDLTTEEVARVKDIKSQLQESDDRGEADKNAKKAIRAAVGTEHDDGGGEPQGKAQLGGGASSVYGKAIMGQIREKAGDANFKAVTATAGSVTVPVMQGVQSMAQPSNYLLSRLVQILSADTNTDGDSVSYLRQTGRTLAARTVARSALKPESTLSFESVADGYCTVAHVVTVPNQYLESFSKFAQILESEMLYGLALGLDDLLLNGGTAENGETIAGIYGTTGVRVTAFIEDQLRTIRRAVGAIQSGGTQPTAIGLHPDDWEAMETTKLTDGSGRYLLDGVPTSAGSPNLWGVPVQLAPSVAVGSSMVGGFDAASIAFANRGGIKLDWNPYSNFADNETILRVEGRFVPVIARPASFARATLTAPAA